MNYLTVPWHIISFKWPHSLLMLQIPVGTRITSFLYKEVVKKKIPKVLRKLLKHCDENNEELWEHMQCTESTDSPQQTTSITLHLRKYRQEPVVSCTISLISVIYLYSQELENYIPTLSCTYHTLVPSPGERWAQLQSLWALSHYWFLWTLQSLATQVHFSGWSRRRKSYSEFFLVPHS